MNKEIIREIKEGLSKPQKEISCKYFYDEKGSSYFEEICQLEEYYLTRTETGILEKNIDNIAERIGRNTLLVELGSGRSIKTKILLGKLKSPAAYVPVDIAKDELLSSSEVLAKEFPLLKIYPQNIDFMKPFTLNIEERYDTITYFFPGSTIGNLEPHAAKEFLRQLICILPGEVRILIGIDLIKDKEVLENAYNDSKGVTADFNLNILNNVNKLTGSDFNIENFTHYSIYNEEHSRIEMYLVSKLDQDVNLNGSVINITKGEKILTEYSYKYSIASFSELIRGVYDVEEIWTDEKKYFAVVLAGCT